MTVNLTDAELVQRCRRGDAGGVERARRALLALRLRDLRPGVPPQREQDAEDVFQEVFTRVYARLDSLRDDAAVRPWIAQLTRRVCLDRLAAAGAREQPVEEFAGGGPGGDEFERVDEAFAVREALAGLSEPCQEILDRFFCPRRELPTIGEELELPAGTIASRISRCLRRLRDELEGRNHTADGSR